MEISFTRKTNDDHIISCIRKNGTVTWMHSSSFFVLHDLCHYAVEYVLGFKKAFYGMLAAGIDIKDFELPKEKRNFQLTEEAIFTEQIVNLLVIEINQGEIENFIASLHQTENHNTGNSAIQSLSKEDLVKIRVKSKALLVEWHSLKFEETIKLIFEE